MSDNRDIGYATFFLGSGIWYFFWGFKRLRRKRKIENIPTSTVRGLAIGLVELIGKAKKMSSITSPLTATQLPPLPLHFKIAEEDRKDTEIKFNLPT